ncbi:MAG: glycerophosphoryl diester phosphodiesterase [Actinomycetota bacterium]
MIRRCRTLLLLLLAMLLIGPTAAHAGPSSTVYAHRGGAGIAPENTMGAFRKSARLYGHRGVWLEMDVQLTSDGVLVVLHDDSLDRTTNCTGTVIEKTAAEVTACDASRSFQGWQRPEPVPTLEKVLREGKRRGWRLSVEIKNIPGEANFDPVGATVAGALVDLVQRTGFPTGRLVAQSFWPASLEAVEREAPAISTALLTTSQLPGAPAGVGLTVLSNALFATARGYEVVSPDEGSVDLGAHTVQAAQALGREVVVWTVDDPTRIAQVGSFGVDGIITNRPDLAYSAMG